MNECHHRRFQSGLDIIATGNNASRRKQAHGCNPWACCFVWGAFAAGLFADVGKQCHHAGTLDRLADRSLERGTDARSFATEHAALGGAELLQTADIFVVNESRTGATLRGTKPALLLRQRRTLLGHDSSYLRTNGKRKYRNGGRGGNGNRSQKSEVRSQKSEVSSQ